MVTWMDGRMLEWMDGRMHGCVDGMNRSSGGMQCIDRAENNSKNNFHDVMADLFNNGLNFPQRGRIFIFNCSEGVFKTSLFQALPLVCAAKIKHLLYKYP